MLWVFDKNISQTLLSLIEISGELSVCIKKADNSQIYKYNFDIGEQ